ncbi:F-actin-monooxygenase MICAL2-like isoform X7 [Acipenser ruthenus]|uniref:F-actin-monooxygenase MICAL2-like isoform X7 n=1 Tax=Acipenser ruthenus TaxID=7906 RepID=UPI0027419F2D|nr:F-actin-monooxygenase MICAL2-like isoform X7 [Acipenser ruthenus]
MGNNDDEKNSQACQLFENFVQASTCKGTLQAFNILCRQLELDPQDYKSFYTALKSKVTFWKAKALWSKLDKRAGHKEYQKGKACPGTRCLIIGGGPCGLRTAIELALLGAKVVVIEKRDTFSRNNVLHLWPYTIHDLRGLGAKKFYGKFCAGAIDHISIQQLQLMLVKVALIVGVEFHVNVEFVKLLEPPEDQENQGTGWRAEIRPMDHPVSDFEFDVVVGADGRRNTLEGFRRKEFRGKLAIAITANFINRNTTAEAKVEEISGVAFIFNQKFFLDLKEETGIDLENIVYYRDNTHYFVMTAKKQSLLDKGVIIHDYIDTEMLLSSENMNQEALLSYAREAADFGTNYQLPSLDFAINHYGQPDVAMFDFTSMHASENAALIRERHGHQLLVALVGDSLLEPFWPMGTGCARGFLAAFDTVWMVRSWIQGRAPLEILAERESIYRLLPQTTPENITKNFDQYTIDPVTRYPNLNCNCVRPLQVRHLYITGELQLCPLERVSSVRRSVNLSRRESEIRPNRLLTWCQKQTESYKNVHVSDLTTSWRSGLALCALIHHFRPDLLDFDCLNEEDVAKNNQLAFDMVEREFGIPPVTTGKEMVADSEPDKLSMVMYLSKFYELFRGTSLPAAANLRREIGDSNEVSSAKSANPLYNFLNLTLPRKRTPKDDKKVEENDTTSKRRRKGFNHLEEASNFSSQSSGSEGGEAKDGGNQNKVKSMASQLLAKFEENAPSSSLRRKDLDKLSYRKEKPLEQLKNGNLGYLRKEFPQTLGGNDSCHFCTKRVYVMERLSAEGRFFHRECFRCDSCNTILRMGIYAFDTEEGKFYCKTHFAQRKTNNKHRKRRTELQKEDTGLSKQEEAWSSPDSANAYSAASTLEDSPAGTMDSFLRKTISWPMRVMRDLFDIPRRLSCWMHGVVHATGLHLRDNADDYAYLYELLSLGVPLLCMLQEVLVHMYQEAAPPTLEYMLEWAENYLGVKLI